MLKCPKCGSLEVVNDALAPGEVFCRHCLHRWKSGTYAAPKTAREIEVEVLSAMTDEELVLAFEKEMFSPDPYRTEAEKKLMRRFFNLVRKGAGMPEVAA